MFLEVSNPAAQTQQTSVFLSATILQANLDIVLWTTLFSPNLSPGIVSITTKSIGPSEDRPICKEDFKFLADENNLIESTNLKHI